MPILQYDFRIVNANAVHGALASIERRVVQHNARMRQAFGGGPVATRAGRPIATTGKTTSDRALREEERSALKAQNYWQRSAQRAADFRIRQEDRANRTIERAHQQAIRRAESEGRRSGLARFRTDQAFARQSKQEREARAATRSALVGGVGRSAVGALGAVGRVGGAALGIAGSFAIGSAIQTQMSESAKASRLANQAGNPELKGGLLREAQSVRGFTGMEALGGLEAFVTKTGNLDAARKALVPLSELALATGSSLEDLGQTAGQVFNVLKGQISDPVQLMNELQMIMGTLAQQGSLGAVEIRDLAKEFGKLGAASRAFEGDSPALLRSMGAFAQIAMEKGGASTSADAATAVSRLAGDIVTKKDKFKQFGVDIQSKTDKTKLRAPEEIMLDVLQKTGGDIMKTSGLFGLESKKVFTGMAATFSEAEKVKKGSGVAAARAEFERFAGAESTPESIRARAASQLSEPEMQFKEAMKEFNSVVGRELLPVLTRLVPEFSKLIPHVADAARVFGVVVEEFARDPLSGIGDIIAAKVALDLAGAGIGAAAKGALEMALNSGLAGAIGKGGLVIGTLAAGIEVANLITKALEIEGKAAAKGATASANAVREKAKTELLTTGKLTPETRAEIEQLSKTEAATLDKAQTAVEGADKSDILRRGFNQIFGTGGGEDMSQLHRLMGVLESDEYKSGAAETEKILDVANKEGLSPEAFKIFAEKMLQAGEQFKKDVAEAGQKIALNRTPQPSTPVP